MTLKKDLKDVGMYLITPVWNYSKHPEVNFGRAAKQTFYGALIFQVTFVGGILFKPVILNKIDDAKIWLESKKIERYNKKN